MPWKPPLDLYKATELKDLALRCRRPNVQWITTALQTVQSENLQRITIHPCHATSASRIKEAVHREWQDLDHLLVQFWTSRSICPKIMYVTGSGLGRYASSLLPDLTRREAVGLVKG